MKPKNKYTIRLQGGLGNQLFGCAAALSLSKKNDGVAQFSKKLLQPGQYELGKYPLLSQVIVEENLISKFRFKTFSEREFYFDENFNNITKSTNLRGYFQSWFYFKDIQDYIRETFSIISEPSNQYSKILSKLEQESFTAFHVRRGDYLGLTSYHGLTSRGYFLRAKSVLSRYSNSEKVVVFSDDIDAAKCIVDWGDLYIGKGEVENSVETLDLMSRATNLVGSNSSFSWWAAFLRDSESGVRVLPRPWFANPKLNDRDLLRPNWITLGI